MKEQFKRRIFTLACSGVLTLSINNTYASGDLLYVSQRDGDRDVYIMNDEGKNFHLINTDSDITEPTWSPDGSKIAFSMLVDGNTDVYVVNKDGTGFRRISNNIGLDFSPKWTADSLRIAYVSDQNPDYSIYLSEIKNDITEPLKEAGSNASQITFSPDGKKAAYVRIHGRSKNMYILDMDTGEAIRLSKGSKYLDGHPSWSIDGKKLAFTTFRNKKYSIRIVNSDGQNEKIILEGDDIKSGITWSPDNKELAFVSITSGNTNRTLFTVNTENSKVNKIGPNNMDLSEPTWSIDGDFLVFSGYSVAERKTNLYKVNKDGSGFSRITEEKVSANYPMFSTSIN